MFSGVSGFDAVVSEVTESLACGREPNVENLRVTASRPNGGLITLLVSISGWETGGGIFADEGLSSRES